MLRFMLAERFLHKIQMGLRLKNVEKKPKGDPLIFPLLLQAKNGLACLLLGPGP